MGWEGGSLSRREFTALSAATVGSLLVSSPASATVPENRSTDLYSYLVENVDDEYQIPTLVEFSDEPGFDELDGMGVEYETYTDETVAAYAKLLPEQASTLAGVDETELLQYQTGANPFWKLEDYEDRVFPDPHDSVDYIGFDEALAGLDYLESEHADRLNVDVIGEGHGLENQFTGEHESREVWVAEVTNNVTDETAFAEKEKLVFEMGIHGNERAGVEAGLRFLEEVLSGDRPEITDKLDEYVLVFLSINPDGWVFREWRYGQPHVPQDFARWNGAGHDPNRQYPVTGFVHPDHLPAEPQGANPDSAPTDGVADDVPEQVREEVPATVATVAYLRQYDDVSHFIDFHGMYGSSTAVLALENSGGTPTDCARRELFNRVLGANLEEKVGPVENWEEAFEWAAEYTEQTFGCEFGGWLCQVPHDLYGYGTGQETLGLSTSGVLSDWAGQPESDGGLGALAYTMEIAFSNSIDDQTEMVKVYNPDLVEFQVETYYAVCETTVEFASSEISATIETNGRSTAYVESGSLTRRSESLSAATASTAHLPGAGGSTGSGDETLAAPDRSGSLDGSHETMVEQTRERLESVEWGSTRIEVDPDVHTLSIEGHATNHGEVELTLTSEDSQTRHVSQHGKSGVCLCPDRVTVRDPTPGTWELDVTVTSGPVDVELSVIELHAEGSPDPQEVLGYEQREYEVTPLGAFEQIDHAATAPIDPLSPEEVADCALLEDGNLVYDNLVLIHDDGTTPEYVDAITEFVESGGNLVLTDAGVKLIEQLDIGGFENVEQSQILQRNGSTFVRDGGGDSPLFTDHRTFADDVWQQQGELWNDVNLGYAHDDGPGYTLIDNIVPSDAETGGDFVGWPATFSELLHNERLGIHTIASLLPPASQENLHPFGLPDHALTMFGYLVLANALGYELMFERDGETTTFGSTVEPVDTDEESKPTEDEQGDSTSDVDSGEGEPDDGVTGSADDAGPGFGIPTIVGGVSIGCYVAYSRLVEDNQTGSD